MRERGDPVYTDVEEVARWLVSADGRSAVEWAMRRQRLPAYFDADLEVMVLRAAELRMQRGDPIQNVPAWTRRVLAMRAMDILKRPAVTQRIEPKRPDSGVMDVDEFDVDDRGLADLLGAVELDGIRIALLWSGRAPAHRVSACLTVLNVVVGRAEPSRTCPCPVAGAGPLEAAHWAGLWYSGQRDCFPGQDGDGSAAVRKRRQRATEATKALLRSAHAAQQGGDDAR